MSKGEFWDYQKHNGVFERWDYDPMTGEAYLNREQDLREWRRMVAETRATGSARKALMPDKEFEAAYSIPVKVHMELLIKGIDPHSQDRDMQRKFIQEMETNYPECKLTDRKLWIPT